MAKLLLKEKALTMRTQGNSIKDIAEKLSVSKSTVSIWCRDIALSESAIKTIAKRGNEKAVTALMQYSERKRTLRRQSEVISAYAGARKLGHLSKRDIYCIGLGLYWGEGYKRGSQELGFTNSDPSMIIFYLRWLKISFNIDKNDLIFRVSININHKHRVQEVELYWSKLLSVPREQFTMTSLIKSPSKKIYKNADNHTGTLRVKVRRGTALRREVLGAIQSIGDYTPNSVNTRR